MAKKSCTDFEPDPEVYCKGDCKSCCVCKWNNSITDKCMIGREG